MTGNNNKISCCLFETENVASTVTAAKNNNLITMFLFTITENPRSNKPHKIKMELTDPGSV